MTARYALELTVILKCGFGLHVDEVVAIGGPDLLVLFPKVCDSLHSRRSTVSMSSTDVRIACLYCRYLLGDTCYFDKALDSTFLPHDFPTTYLRPRSIHRRGALRRFLARCLPRHRPILRTAPKAMAPRNPRPVRRQQPPIHSMRINRPWNRRYYHSTSNAHSLEFTTSQTKEDRAYVCFRDGFLVCYLLSGVRGSISNCWDIGQLPSQPSA